MRNDRIRFIKNHCFDFMIGDTQKQYYRNGDLTYKFNYSNKLSDATKLQFDNDGGTWIYEEPILYYRTRNGEGVDINSLDLHTLIRIDVDSDGYLFASIPYNISEDVSFEISNRGVFIINEN